MNIAATRMRPILTVGMAVPTKLLWEPPRTVCRPYRSDFRDAEKSSIRFRLSQKKSGWSFSLRPDFFSYAAKSGAPSPTASNRKDGIVVSRRGKMRQSAALTSDIPRAPVIIIISLPLLIPAHNRTVSTNMSASAASASTASASSATKHRKEAKFTFSTIKHIRDVIAVICLDLMKTKTLTVAKQQSTAYELFHGDMDQNIMGEAEKFISGRGVYAKMTTTEGGGVALWIEEQTRAGPRAVISEAIHRQIGKSLVRGDNITHNLISRTYESKSDLYKGDQILTHARVARAECRKMDGLLRDALKEKMLTCENGEYSFPSGKTILTMI